MTGTGEQRVSAAIRAEGIPCSAAGAVRIYLEKAHFPSWPGRASVFLRRDIIFLFFYFFFFSFLFFLFFFFFFFLFFFYFAEIV